MSKLIQNGLFMLAVWLGSAVGHAQDNALPAGDGVTIVFKVDVPADTPEADTVYLCGDHELFGNWDGRGLELQRQYDGSYVGSVTLARGADVQFKATRGSWETVEKSLAGGEMTNREVVADQDREVELVVEAWASGEAKRPEPTLTGDIRRHDGFRSDILDNERTLIVYIPPGYDEKPDARYPVLYMHDGQNIFDASTSFAGHEWRVDEAAEQLILAGQIEPIIIVGMYNNSQRMSEYNAGDRDADGTDYTQFVVDEVKPFIEKTYRADAGSGKTGVAGSSMGGLISLYMAQVHPDVFGRCAIVSPALGIQNRRYLDSLLIEDATWMRGTYFWLDMGTAEARASSQNLVVQHTRDLAALFYRAKLDGGMDYQYVEVEGGEHNEQAWSRRIDAILRYLYGTP